MKGTAMETPPQIVVTVRPDGSVEAETQGITGPRCLDYIAVLEDLIAGTTAASAFTSDYRSTAVTDASPTRVGLSDGTAR